MLPSVRQQTRLDYLDSIRGVAAFAVVLDHCWLLNPDIFRNAHYGMASVTSIPNLFFYSLSKLHESGRSAVMIFFVLSGFVLAYSLQKNSVPYFGYAVKRVFRIYPTFLFVIMSSYALHKLIDVRHHEASFFLEKLITPDLSLVVLLKHLTLWGTAGSRELDGVIWSLVHEMRISLIFPFILFAVKRYKWRSILFFWLISFVCTVWIFHTTGTVITGYQEETFPRTLLDTGYFIVFFAAGAYLASEHEAVALKIVRLPKWGSGLLFLIVIYCLLKTDYSNHTIWGVVVDYMRGIGAVGLIALALGIKKLSKGLSHDVLVWLGRVSYSLYLVHIPILYVVNQTIGVSWSVLHASIVLMVLSLLVAEILARFVEFPSIKLGKKLCAKL